MRKSLSAVAMVVGSLMLMASALTATAGPVSATHNGENCEATYKEVVDKPAWTETVEHDAEYKYIEHPAVTKTVEGVWANWAPNDTQGPQDYTPIWPTDERGTWIPHKKLPPGHEGPDGVYQKGEGNSSYFYRQAEKVVVEKEAWTEKKLVKEAWTETIEHEATYKTVVDEPGHCETTTTTEPTEVSPTTIVRPTTTTTPPTTEPPVTVPPVTEPPVTTPPVTTPPVTTPPIVEPPVTEPPEINVPLVVERPVLIAAPTVPKVVTPEEEDYRYEELAATGSSDSLPVLTLTGIGLLVLGVAMSRKSQRI